MMRHLTTLLLTTAFALPAARTLAQDAVLPGRPDTVAPDGEIVLGKPFLSTAAGIGFKSPPDCKEIRRPVNDEIVQFVDDTRKWNLRVTRETLNQAMPLASTNENNVPRLGRIDMLIEQMKRDAPSVQIFQQDVSNVGDSAVGIVRSRATYGSETRLRQQALVQANDKLFYLFDFLTPAPPATVVEKAEDLAKDPQIVSAVRLFDAIVDSIKLVDQDALIDEQNERLFRTRTLYLNLTESKVRAALTPMTLLRIIKDGKDVGYSVIFEEIATDLPRANVKKASGRIDDGVLVGIRSHSVPEVGTKVDAETWQWCSLKKRSDFGWKREEWVSVVTHQDAKNLARVGEQGVTDSEIKRKIDPDLPRGEIIKNLGKPGQQSDDNQPPVREVEAYTLNVTQAVYNREQKMINTAGKPMTQALPPFYLPQAMSQLLPRLLPRGEVKGYLFGYYVPDQRGIVKRFLDVGDEQPIQLAGQNTRGIPISDRIGYEGSTTIHYVSREGKYLGSVNADASTTVLVADEATLRGIWKDDLNLERPGAVTE